MNRSLAGFDVLASDFDGTLAHEGKVSASTVAALVDLRAAGRRIVLVTGREIPSLEATFDRLDLFDVVVAENGAVLYWPRDRRYELLGEPPDATFVAALRSRGVAPLSVGRVIVATWEPHENTVLQTIADLGLELQIIFNKGAVMVLPTAIDKLTGLRAALAQWGTDFSKVVGVGDAENDHAFLRGCGLAVAVANALPAVRERVDLVTHGARGQGVEELIAQWLHAMQVPHLRA